MYQVIFDTPTVCHDCFSLCVHVITKCLNMLNITLTLSRHPEVSRASTARCRTRPCRGRAAAEPPRATTRTTTTRPSLPANPRERAEARISCFLRHCPLHPLHPLHCLHPIHCLRPRRRRRDPIAGFQTTARYLRSPRPAASTWRISARRRRAEPALPTGRVSRAAKPATSTKQKKKHSM
jgi:hypothetical protein